MIPSIHKRGSTTGGLLRYLYGPGTHEEHTDPHLVAAFDPLTPDPGRDPSASLADLKKLLDQPVAALPAKRRPQKHAWHISVRASPEDRTMSDEEWAAIARRTVAATGIAPEGDSTACRWAAVRHADDHIHIIATLVREDGRRPRLHNEARRAQAEARRIESDYGLRRVAAGDGTAAKRPTSAERRKAARLGQEASSKELLREHVRQAVAGAVDEAEFFDRLHAQGVLVRKRVAPSGDVLGFNVAVTGDRNGKGEPVWFAGSTLAPDLSLPRIRRRFTASLEPHDGAEIDRTEASRPARARYALGDAIETALPKLTGDDEASTAAQFVGLNEVIDALVQTSAEPSRGYLRQAARHFERASRSHVRARDEEMFALRRAARQIVASGTALGKGPDAAAAAFALDLLFAAVVIAARWHAAKRHAQQAEAARSAAQHLRNAYRATAQAQLAALHTRGKTLPAWQERSCVATVRDTVPEFAERLLTEPGWPALKAAINQTVRSGKDPAAALRQAVAERELDSAASLSEVLIWRLDRLGYLNAPPSRPSVSSRPRGLAGSPPAQPPAPASGTVRQRPRR